MQERTLKPSAQPTLVRTQHLPHPGETARWLRKHGPAGRFFLSRRVSRYVTAGRYVAVSTDGGRAGGVLRLDVRR